VVKAKKEHLSGEVSTGAVATAVSTGLAQRVASMIGATVLAVHSKHTIKESRNCGVNLHEIRVAHEVMSVVRYH
jgi:hypothetical protein